MKIIGNLLVDGIYEVRYQRDDGSIGSFETADQMTDEAALERAALVDLLAAEAAACDQARQATRLQREIDELQARKTAVDASISVRVAAKAAIK